jgi:hypothetical protein
MKILQSMALFISLTVISFSAQAAESYNLTTEFSTASNPNGVWTYGRYTSGGLDKSTFSQFTSQLGFPADLNLIPQCNPADGGILEGWRDATDPNVIINNGAEHYCGGFGGITFHAGAVTFGPHNGPAVVRFTVPSAGDWLVVATFTGVQVGNDPGATASIHNGTAGDTTFDAVLPAPVANGVTSSYNQTLTLPANATIDIVVGSGSKTTEVTATITKQSINVGIDIKPGSDPNSINLCSNGAVPVAILGSETFNVYDIDTTTLMFADAGVKVVGKKDKELCSYENVNGDVFNDLVCHFVTMDISAIDGASVSATVSGALLGGTAIEGMDSVNIVKDTCN